MDLKRFFINVVKKDIDECDKKTHTCGQRDACVNTRGSFKCLKMDCPEGYTLIGEKDSKK